MHVGLPALPVQMLLAQEHERAAVPQGLSLHLADIWDGPTFGTTVS